MILAVGCDHAGFPMKAPLLQYLRDAGHVVTDCGSYDPDPADFPDIARLVCAAVRTGAAERGLMICGTGVGAAIAANKIAGIRAAVCHDVHSAHQSVEHDDVNVMCVGAKIIGQWLALDLVSAFLAARFDADEDVRRRVQKLSDLELASAAELLGQVRSE
jgi:ribose 5-phosphate isomerase B